VKRPEKRSGPDGEEHVNEYREPLADLSDKLFQPQALMH
jgi:hypothetical protein